MWLVLFRVFVVLILVHAGYVYNPFPGRPLAGAATGGIAALGVILLEIKVRRVPGNQLVGALVHMQSKTVTDEAAKSALKYPPVRFDDPQRNAIADGFATAIGEGSYIIHACCIGHDHSHLVVTRHERTIERIASHLKSKATMALSRQEIHPLRNYLGNNQTVPTPWSGGCWSVFIDDRKHLNSSMRYVERHPAKEGLPSQNWSFITPA